MFSTSYPIVTVTRSAVTPSFTKAMLSPSAISRRISRPVAASQGLDSTCPDVRERLSGR